MSGFEMLCMYCVGAAVSFLFVFYVERIDDRQFRAFVCLQIAASRQLRSMTNANKSRCTRWIIYYKCVEGMLWTASWEKVLIGPSAAYAIHTNTSLGKNTINIDVAKRKIEKELKKNVEKEFR